MRLDPFEQILFDALQTRTFMCATEVLLWAQEERKRLGLPALTGQSELLGPIIEKQIDLLAERGLLPPVSKEWIA